MAIKQALMLKTVLGNNAFTLEAKTGESLNILDIMVYSPTLEKYLSVKIDKTVVGYFRTSGLLGGHLSMSGLGAQHSHDFKISSTAAAAAVNQELYDANGGAQLKAALVTDNIAVDNTVFQRLAQFAKSNSPPLTLLGYLRGKGLFNGYPMEPGQILTLTGVAEASAVVVVIYQTADEGDFSRTDPNGSEATDYIFVNYGRPAAAVTATADTILASVQNPAEFPDFPYVKLVPANTEVDILGILGSPIMDYDAATDFTRTNFLKFVQDRITLWDDDRNGLLMLGVGTAEVAQTLVGEGFSMIGNYSDVDHRPPFMFDNGLTFLSGEELGVYIVSEESTNPGSIAASYLEIGLISRIRKI